MSVSRDRKKNKVVRATTTALNLSQNNTIWRCFTGKDKKKYEDMNSEDMFIQLTLFIYGLSCTIGTEPKELKYFREEPLKSALLFIIQGRMKDTIFKPTKDTLDVLKHYVTVARTDYLSSIKNYNYCFSKSPNTRFMFGLLALLEVLRKIKTKFDKDEKAILKEEMNALVRDSLTSTIDILSSSNGKRVCATFKIREEKLDEIIKLLEEERQREGA